jgi:hypothetical protein
MRLLSIGDTINMQIKRQTFYDPEEIAQTTKKKAKEIIAKGCNVGSF